MSNGVMDKTEFVGALQQQVGSLRTYATWLTRDKEQANDLTQETLIAAYVNHHRYVFKGSFGAWLRRILFNKYINERRRSQRWTSLEDVDTSVLDSLRKSSDPSLDFIGGELEEHINDLEDRFRQPLQLRVRGFKYEEIAQKLEIPVGTVKNRIFEGRKLLRNQWPDEQTA